MTEQSSPYAGPAPDPTQYSDLTRYNALMDVVRNRLTSRQFDPRYTVPREHYELILEAARHGPSGANAQPWHYIVVTEAETKRKIADYFVDEQRVRAKLRMKFPTPNYRGLETAPGFIVVASDFRWTRAFPVLMDGSELDRKYHENAERILLQSVAASTMSAHLAAAALGYQVWWVTAIGQDDAQKALKPLLGVPDDLAVIDIMLFRPAGQAALQALEEVARPDPELGQVQPGQPHDGGADRRLGEGDAAQGDVPRREDDRLSRPTSAAAQNFSEKGRRSTSCAHAERGWAWVWA